MDANGRIIPLVEGDQGEGIKDPYEGKDDDPFRRIKEPYEKEKVSFEDLVKKQADETAKDRHKEVLKQEFTGKPLPPPQRMRIKKGMRIHFYGYSYKVTAVRPNGKITLRFDGIWKGDQR